MTEELPTSITANCHKYLVTQPNGIKNTMKYLQNHINVELSHPNHKKIAYSLCLFHSIINDLLKYKPYGWSMDYQFNTCDFTNALKFLKDIV